MTTIAANTHPTMIGIKSLLDTPPPGHSLASYNFYIIVIILNCFVKNLTWNASTDTLILLNASSFSFEIFMVTVNSFSLAEKPFSLCFETADSLVDFVVVFVVVVVEVVVVVVVVVEFMVVSQLQPSGSWWNF